MEDTSGSEESGEGNEASGTTDPSNDKKQKNCKSKRSVKRQLKTFSFGKWQKGFNKDKTKKRTFSLSKDNWQSCSSVVSEASVENVTCICTGYRKTKASTSSVEKSNAPPEKEASQEPPPEATGGSYLAVACQGSASGDESEEQFVDRIVPASRDYCTQQVMFCCWFIVLKL